MSCYYFHFQVGSRIIRDTRGVELKEPHEIITCSAHIAVLLKRRACREPEWKEAIIHVEDKERRFSLFLPIARFADAAVVGSALVATVAANLDPSGKPLVHEKGELVCTRPFPSMPVGFWNDADGSKYRAAYFEQYPGVWRHGDWVELTEHGGMIIYGRSDAVLNPGGVRIGTAEIYRQVEQLDEVVESLVIGQDWPPQQPTDVRVVLFVRLRDGLRLDAALTEKIRNHIRATTTTRHVPARIVQVSDIPRTKSGKIVELAVRNVVHGRAVKNLEALANPEALELFRNRRELSQ